MSINIQLDGKLQKISGQTMTKEKIVEKLGYTPANETIVNTTITNLENTVDADIAAVNADLSDLKAALENYIKDHPDIVEDGSGEVVFTDEAGNIIAKLDADGFHTTDIEADSFISNDDNLIINDLDGNKIFQVDKDGVETTKLKLASGDIDEQLDSLAADIAAVEAKIPEIPVTSVNGKTGDVELEYSDLKNAPAIEAEENEKSLIITDNSGNIVLKAGHLDEADDKLTGIETTEVILPGGKVDERISGLTADLAAHTGNTTKHITDTERNTWNNKSDFSGEFKDLLNSPIEEDNSGELVYADESGNIALKIGKLDEETTGLETIEIKLKGGKVDERIETLTADLSEHKNNIDIHITKEERADWNAKATTKYVDDTVAAVVNSAPEVLNTLDELAAALGDDANFATTVTNKIAEKATQADFVAHRDDTVKHITAAERTTWNNKSEFSGNYTDLNGAPDISTDEEDNSLLVTDKTGNIVFKAGNLDENTTGIETATIKAKAADIDNIYDKLTVDAKLAALDEAKANDGHGHIISAGATGDPIITLKGTSGDLAVSYEVSHAISGVGADTYTKVTVDAYGHVTEGDNPTTLAGFGITDAYTNEETDAKIAAHIDATTAHNKAQVGLSNVDNTSDADKPISTATQTALDALKEEIVSESDSWTIVDESGNIMLKAGQLDNDVVGLETTTVVAQEVLINGNNAATENYVDVAIDALDVSDSAVNGKYVSAVSQTNGKISVTRADLPTLSKETDTTDTLTLAHGGTFTAVTDTTVNGHTITDKTTTFTLPTETTLSKGTDTSGTATLLSHGDTFTVMTDTSVSGHTITDQNTTFTLPSETVLSKSTTTGTGNAVTDISVNGHEITLTKGKTFLEAHPDTAMLSDTTSTESPSYNGTFTAVDTITRDGKGHVTKINTKTIDLEDAFETFRSEISEEIVSEANEWTVTDESGNIIFQVNEDGAHTTKLELLSGDIDEQLDEIKTATHTHTVTHTPAGTNSEVSITPAGTVTSTFSGQAATHGHSFTGTATAHDHTFTGIEALISTSYTPVGSVSKPTFSGTKATISTKFTPSGIVSKPTFTGTEATISTKYTPAGTISKPTFNGTEATISTTYTPAGSVSKPTFTGSAVTSNSPSNTTTVYSITDEGALPTLTANVTNRCLKLTFGAGTLPTKGSGVSVATGEHTHNVTASGTISKPTFSGTEATISTSYTPAGTINTPTFTGTEATISTKYTPAGTISTPVFTGTEGTVSAEYTPAGTISTPTFSGTQATISMTYTPEGNIEQTTLTPAGTISSESTTPAGTVTSTFAGTETKHKHTFTGSAATLTTSAETII